jgi:choline dehydrogenase-like flavoprotein
MSGAIIQYADLVGRPRVEDAADVVIIGSGAAGATAARVLTEAGLEVIVIEEGPHVPSAELRSDMYTSMRRMWRDMGFQVAQGRAVTPILQGSCVGGTTAINGAIIHRIPEPIREQWCKEHGAGALLDPNGLAAVFDRLDQELSVGTAPDAVFGRQNALMEQAAAKLGWKGNRIRRNVRDCDGSAHCNQGCPNARRQSMNNSFVPAAVARGARVYATCRADRLIVEGGRAVGVRGRMRDPVTQAFGPEVALRARHAGVLAASAIQSPRFLLDNGLGKQARVGQGLMCHPGTAVAGIFDEPVRQWAGATQGFESTHYWQERLKFETVAMPLELAAVRLPGFGARLMRQMADFGHVAFFGVQVRARARGRVGRNAFGGKSIRFEMDRQDVATLKQGVLKLCELMFAAGAREVSPGVHGLPERVTSVDPVKKIFELPDDPRLFHCIAAHLFATAPMGDDPRRSVVDPELRVRGIEGLYLTDSSVFPTNMGVNPQHGICALSWLACERLAERALADKSRGAHAA